MGEGKKRLERIFESDDAGKSTTFEIDVYINETQRE